MDRNSRSPGICQRLINFILGKVRRPEKLPGSRQVPVEEGPLRYGKESIRPNDFSDAEFVVDYKHTNVSESWNQTNKRGGSTHAPKNDQTILQNGLDRKERNKDHLAPRMDQKSGVQGQVNPGKGPRKTVTIKENEKKKEANHSADDQAIPVHNPTHDESKPTHQRPHWPLLSVTSNINEKSAKFIERKKEAMRRNYSLDQKKEDKGRNYSLDQDKS